MSYVDYIEKHPQMSVIALTKHLGCKKGTVYAVRHKLKKGKIVPEVCLESRPRKVKKSFLNGDLIDDIKSIKKIGVERVKLICRLLQEE